MNTAIIVAGGKGRRMGGEINKQYLKINGKEILAYTIEAFENCKAVDEIILVVPEGDVNYCENEIINKYSFGKIGNIIEGGNERQESVLKGLLSCNPKTKLVAIHDGVRPFVNNKAIEESFYWAEKTDACAVGVPLKDTVKTMDENMFSTSTLDRSKLFGVQTPQTFNYKLIFDAHMYAREKRIIVTDDTALIESIGKGVKLIMGDYFNIKITTREDLVIGEAIIKHMEMK